METVKNKSKSAEFTALLLVAIMIIGCFTTACQPTPEEQMVQSKNNDELEQAIAQTAEPTRQANEETQESQSEPIIVQDSSSNSSNTVHVNIDAEVINNQTDSITVAKIAPKYFTSDEVEQMARAFFGEATIYEQATTKDDYERLILNLQKMMTDEEAMLNTDYAVEGEITDIEKIKQHINERINKLVEKRVNAPDERQVLTKLSFSSDESLSALADIGDGYMGYINATDEVIRFTAFADDSTHSQLRSFNYNNSVSIDLNSDNDEFQNAKEMAIQMIADMGIEGVRLGDAYLAEDDCEGIEGVESGRQYYVFCFEKLVGDSALDHTLCWGTLMITENVDDTVYEKLREYERLQIWIEGDEIVQFRYRMPMEVTEILNDNVALPIDYVKAIELAKNYAYVRYVELFTGITETKVNIEKIELVLVRTKEADTGDYIVVPAWNFCGHLEMHLETGEWQTRAGNWDGNETLITINALDGTIVDMERGY